MIRIDSHVDVRAIEEAVVTASSQPIEPDPGRGYWDGFDIGPTEHYGVRPHGGALVRVRVVAASHGPSGPCGKAVEVIRVG